MNSIQGIVDIVIEFYKTIDPDLRIEIKKKYGSSAPVFHWRYLQKAIHDKIPDFLPQDFEAWWADNSKQYNEDSELKLREIRDAIVDSVHGFLETKGIELPYGLSIDLGKNLVEINARRKQEGLSLKGEWDIFSLKDCHTLAHSGSLWTEGLKELLTRPEDRTRKGGNKVQKTKWLLDLDGIIKSLRQPGYSVKSADYVYITTIYNWLFPRTE